MRGKLAAQGALARPRRTAGSSWEALAPPRCAGPPVKR